MPCCYNGLLRLNSGSLLPVLWKITNPHMQLRDASCLKKQGSVRKVALLMRVAVETSTLIHAGAIAMPMGLRTTQNYEWHVRVPKSEATQLDSIEHSASRWVPLGCAADEVWSWTNKEALNALSSELRTNSQSV